MPLFKYRCTKCGNIIEVLEKVNAQGRHTCEKCGNRRMEKMMSAFSVGAGNQGGTGSSCPTGTCPLS